MNRLQYISLLKPIFNYCNLGPEDIIYNVYRFKVDL